MNLRIEVLYEIPSTEIYNQIEKLHNDIFESNDHLMTRLSIVDHPIIILAYTHDELIAYKIGYRLNDSIFYSWIGSVHPEYRNNGVAQRLMEEQQKLAKQQGYKTLQTKTMNKWKSMLILNIKNDFKIVETYYDNKNQHKILLEKNI